MANLLDSFYRKFTYKNNFSAQLVLPNEPKLGSFRGTNVDLFTLKGFTLDAITPSMAAEYQAGMYNFCYVSQKETTCTIEVYEETGNYYHTLFTNVLLNLYDSYPDDSFCKLVVYKLADYGDRSEIETIYTIHKCFISSINSLALDSTSEADVQTTTITFVFDPKQMTIEKK